MEQELVQLHIVNISPKTGVINSDRLSQVTTAGVIGVTGASVPRLVTVARHTGSVSATAHMARGMKSAQGPERAPRVVTAIPAQMDPLLMTLWKV